MKRLGIITLLAAFLIQGFSQDISAENKGDQKQAVVTSGNDIVATKDNLMTADDSRSSGVQYSGTKGIAILESLEGKNTGPDYSIPPVPAREFFFCNDDEKDISSSKKRNRFKGHWAGVEFGFNNYLTDAHDLSLPSDIDYMTLHSGKSRSFGINAGQLSIGLARHIGFVTGVGLTWNNYRFDQNNTIQKGPDGWLVNDDPGTFKKSKLATIYLKVPLLFEMQIPTDHDRINISAGPVGAIKLSSKTVTVLAENDEKIKSDGDFNLNMLRYGATARIGYENFNFFATYYFTPLFKSNMGPAPRTNFELFPFEIGISFTIDD